MSTLSFSARRVLIRTDANEQIASGHVMRCLSVADVLKDAGMEVCFVLSDANAVFAIERRGYLVRVLGSDWHDLTDGMAKLKNICTENDDVPVLLVDSYSVTREFVDSAAAFAKVCYLGSKGGDLGALSLIVNYSTDIDESFYQSTYGGRGTRLLLGPGYAPLRAQFADAYRKPGATVHTVLVTTGNTDPFGFTPLFLHRALTAPTSSRLAYQVIMGSMYENRDEVEEIAAAHENVSIYRGVSDMADLMSSCDIAISANGTTVYELAAVGVPAITFAMVGEQVQSAESLSRLGAVRYVGVIPEMGVSKVTHNAFDALVEYVTEPQKATKLSLAAHSLIDGSGARKIAEELARL